MSEKKDVPDEDPREAKGAMDVTDAIGVMDVTDVVNEDRSTARN
ncbi:hypothetical protein [Streptomyces shenzhenensis]|nr:hypothetical protein [Streptomyces shenzhenensis]